MNSKTRLRFTEEDDLLLLKEVVSINPFEDQARWEEIRAHIENVSGKGFKLRSIKEHTDLLVNNFLKKEKIMKDKSGIEEIVTEKDILLTDLILLIKDFETRQKPKKKNAIQVLREKGKEARDHWAEQFNVLDNIENRDDNQSGNIFENEIAEEIFIINSDSPEVMDVSIEASGSKQTPEQTPTVKTSTIGIQKVLGTQRGRQGSKRTLGNEKVCDVNGLHCLAKYKEKLIMLEDGCSCLPNCNDVNYVVEDADIRPWFLGSSLQWGLKSYPEIRLKRDVLFRFSDLVVYIGGMMGLFYGGSVLSIIEMFYFGTIRFCVEYSRHRFQK